MIFINTRLKGAFIIDIERNEDVRGFFARTFCQDEFSKLGMNTMFSQCSISFNYKRGTLRGMHYQTGSDAEIKIVRCTMGCVYDVILDLRPDSFTYGQWMAIELSAENRRMIYIPEGFAHGFQTLADATEVLYHISRPFNPLNARGVRWDDPAFGIHWPLPVSVLSPRDMSFPTWNGTKCASF